jgi:hypothetical protein
MRRAPVPELAASPRRVLTMRSKELRHSCSRPSEAIVVQKVFLSSLDCPWLPDLYSNALERRTRNPNWSPLETALTFVNAMLDLLCDFEVGRSRTQARPLWSRLELSVFTVRRSAPDRTSLVSVGVDAVAQSLGSLKRVKSCNALGESRRRNVKCVAGWVMFLCSLRSEFRHFPSC